jgi:hypothetical protein
MYHCEEAGWILFPDNFSVPPVAPKTKMAEAGGDAFWTGGGVPFLL